MPLQPTASIPIAAVHLRVLTALLAALAGCAWAGSPPKPSVAALGEPARFLYIWAGDKDERDSDFLAVIDVRRASPTYGQVVTTVPVGMTGTLPHHLEYALPPAGQTLFANGHHHEVIFRFDVADAEHPKLVGIADQAPPLRYPHDFARLATNTSSWATSGARGRVRSSAIRRCRVITAGLPS